MYLSEATHFYFIITTHFFTGMLSQTLSILIDQYTLVVLFKKAEIVLYDLYIIFIGKLARSFLLRKFEWDGVLNAVRVLVYFVKYGTSDKPENNPLRFFELPY